MSDTTAAIDEPTVTPPADEIAAAIEAMGPELLDELNDDYSDAILLVAQVLGECPGATGARCQAIDSGGVELLIHGPEGEVDVRVAFANRLTDLGQVATELFALVTRSREQSGTPGTTSAERTMAEMSAIRTFLTEVVAVEDVHPHLRRITFGGGDLATFTPGGPDTFVYVLLPPAGRTELTIDQGFTWEAYEAMPEEERPLGAYYTVRRWRAEQAELEMLFVLHGDEGPASRWAAAADPGDPVALWGPRTGYAPPDDTDWYLLVADDTGLPAVAAILESLPVGTVARVFAEVDGEHEYQELPSSPSFEVTWLHREGAPAGTTSLLVDAVRALPWPGGSPYAWGGGESRAVTAVRRYLRDEVGLRREAVSMTGYWRS